MHYLALAFFTLYGSFVMLFVVLFMADIEDKQVRTADTDTPPAHRINPGNYTLLEETVGSVAKFGGHVEH